ncbi:MAG: Sensor histidine kinase YpdA [Firmicutes bacterium ADurb.Bin182]|nr:MAG: Sensor histidine kinase YpdA [Firmicutes bacterium ADurb.Bin182]
MEKVSKQGISLKWSLIAIIVLCWVVPIFLITGAVGLYISKNVKNRINDTIISSVDSAVDLVQNEVDSAIGASRKASYDPAIRNAYNRFLYDGDSVALYESITDFLTLQYKYDEKFITTLLYFSSDPETLYYTYNPELMGTFAGIKQYRELVHEKVKETSPGLGTRFSFLYSGERLYMVRNILGSDYKPYAVIVMELNIPMMFGSLQSVVWETACAVKLEDAVLPVKGSFMSGTRLEESIFAASPPVSVRENVYTVRGFRQGEAYTLSYVLEADSRDLTNELTGYWRVLSYILMLTVPLLVIVLLFFYRNFSRPVVALMQSAQKIERGELGVRVAEDWGSSEFRILTSGFNSMSSKLKYQFERIYQEQAALQEARIKALQSQINPHFLNNTLEIINWEARMSGDSAVSRMIEALSTMLTAATGRDEKASVQLREELEYVDAYLYIISVRFGKRLNVRREIDDSLLDIPVPRLILQPIVENAVEHGITPRMQGAIVLRVYRNDDKLVMEVENDGKMTEQDIKAVELLLNGSVQPAQQTGAGSSSLGIRNINQRLKILYKEQCSFTIEMTEEGNTLARVAIGPLPDIRQ